MPNKNAKFGFLPLDGMLRVRQYWKDTTAGIICVGDPVVRVTSSSDVNGYPEIVRATTAGAVTGVVVAIVPDVTNLNKSNCLLAADSGYVLVCDDPNQKYIVQDNGGATTITPAMIGKHINSVAAINGDTTFGRSNYELDTEGKLTGATWRLEGKYDQIGNDYGANCIHIVKANLHTEVNASATTLTEV